MSINANVMDIFDAWVKHEELDGPLAEEAAILSITTTSDILAITTSQYTPHSISLLLHNMLQHTPLGEMRKCFDQPTSQKYQAQLSISDAAIHDSSAECFLLLMDHAADLFRKRLGKDGFVWKSGMQFAVSEITLQRLPSERVGVKNFEVTLHFDWIYPE